MYFTLLTFIPRRYGERMDERDRAREQRLVAEEFGLLFEEMGGTRMAGRVAAWLLLSDPPVQSLTDIAGALGVSKAAVSTAVRSLLQAGHVERVSEPGTRGDYYRSRATRIDAVLQLGHIEAMRGLVRRCLQLVADKDQTQSNYALLHEMEDFLDFLETEIPGLMERWQSACAARRIADVDDTPYHRGAP
jgi:DNA-binding transcriptional regulator GbsR (MarR family)